MLGSVAAVRLVWHTPEMGWRLHILAKGWQNIQSQRAAVAEVRMVWAESVQGFEVQDSGMS